VDGFSAQRKAHEKRETSGTETRSADVSQWFHPSAPGAEFQGAGQTGRMLSVFPITACSIAAALPFEIAIDMFR